MSSKHTVAVTFTGDVLSLYLELEGRQVQLMSDGKGKWHRKINEFPIDPGLNVLCIAKGFAGTACNLIVKIDDRAPNEFPGEIPGAKPFIVDREINL